MPTDTAPAGYAYNFFAGGNAPVSKATRSITLTAGAGAIDQGEIRYLLSAHPGGYANRYDSASFTAYLLDAHSDSTGDRVTGGPVTIGPVLAAGRGGQHRFRAAHHQRLGSGRHTSHPGPGHHNSRSRQRL